MAEAASSAVEQIGGRAWPWRAGGLLSRPRKGQEASVIPKCEILAHLGDTSSVTRPTNGVGISGQGPCSSPGPRRPIWLGSWLNSCFRLILGGLGGSRWRPELSHSAQSTTHTHRRRTCTSRSGPLPTFSSQALFFPLCRFFRSLLLLHLSNPTSPTSPFTHHRTRCPSISPATDELSRRPEMPS